ncbi:MAG TPA: outer membrane beta-barrel protein [Candidatus Angelobacter sp.]|nr:outer membrane beta-barrel protein [Candidatus Angelobacter sp.]
MRKYLLAVIVLSFSIASWAQRTSDMSHEGSSGDVYIGYSLLNGDTLSHGSGWEAALTGNLRDWLGLKADFGGNYASEAGIPVHEYNVQFGPQLAARSNKLRFFVHGLVGIAHFNLGGLSDTAAAWTLGGGVDYDLNQHFAARMFQLDYHGAHIFSSTQKDARFSFGLIYRFR